MGMDGGRSKCQKEAVALFDSMLGTLPQTFSRAPPTLAENVMNTWQLLAYALLRDP